MSLRSYPWHDDKQSCGKDILKQISSGPPFQSDLKSTECGIVLKEVVRNIASKYLESGMVVKVLLPEFLTFMATGKFQRAGP